MKMVLIVGGIAATLVVVVGAFLWMSRSGPDPAQFAALRNPRISRLPDQPMLVVEAKGDPNVVGARAFKALFGTYFRLSGVPKGRAQPAPRARWPVALDAPKSQWVGHYALPLPATAALAAVPGGAAGAHVESWPYGLVAEVLHVGSYATEQPDIDRLRAFVATGGYTIVGDHEEEYVKGPGMFFAGNPETYLTIIRYRVQAPQ